jgi:hypothetical protein
MRIFIIFLSVFLFDVSEAVAASLCDKRTSIVYQLQYKYQEVQANVAVTNTGHLVEIYESAEGETWTIIITDPKSKMSCIVLAGLNWITKEKEELGYDH